MYRIKMTAKNGESLITRGFESYADLQEGKKHAEALVGDDYEVFSEFNEYPIIGGVDEAMAMIAKVIRMADTRPRTYFSNEGWSFYASVSGYYNDEYFDLYLKQSKKNEEVFFEIAHTTRADFWDMLK